MSKVDFLYIMKFCMLRDVSVLWRLENKLLGNTYFFFGRGQKFCLFPKENYEEKKKRKFCIFTGKLRREENYEEAWKLAIYY